MSDDLDAFPIMRTYNDRLQNVKIIAWAPIPELNSTEELSDFPETLNRTNFKRERRDNI